MAGVTDGVESDDPDESGMEEEQTDIEDGEQNNHKENRVRKRKDLQATSSEEELTHISKKKPDIAATSTYNSIPVNKTLLSQPKCTIILRPIGKNVPTFSTDPIGLAKALMDSAFNKVEKKDVRTNTRRNIIAIELENTNEETIAELLTITKFGKWQVNCYRPKVDIFVIGVIKNIHQTVDIEELQQYLKVPNNIPIVKITRLDSFQNRERKPSTSIKVEFKGEHLPERIYLGHLSYRVFAYVFPPLRCFRCQRMGHLASGCDAKIKCLVCSGNHYKEDCLSDILRCANCNGDHVASSKACRYIKEGKQVESLKSKGMTNGEAIREVNRGRSEQVQKQRPPWQKQTYPSQNIIPRKEINSVIQINNEKFPQLPSLV